MKLKLDLGGLATSFYRPSNLDVSISPSGYPFPLEMSKNNITTCTMVLHWTINKQTCRTTQEINQGDLNVIDLLQIQHMDF